MDRVLTFVLGGAALILAVTTGVLGFTIPSIWTMSGDVGGIKATLAAVDKRLESFEKRLDGLDVKLTSIEKIAATVDMRLASRETDPALLMAQAGLRPEAEFGTLKVNGNIYAFPKSEKAAKILEKAGLTRVAVTPFSFGYLIGVVTEQGAFKGMSTPEDHYPGTTR